MIAGKILKRWLWGALVLVLICGAMVGFVPHDRVTGHWTSTLPPLLAIVLAWVTQNVYLSLGIAIGVGGLLTQGTALLSGLGPWLTGLWTSLQVIGGVIRPWAPGGGIAENMWILGFVFIIFAMVEVLIASGGFLGVIRLLLPFIRGRRSAEFMTALMGLAVFIDDYTNSIVVGSAMRPIGDRFRVSREKLAFLVDGTSAPIAGLSVISTWIAYEVSLFTKVAAHEGIDKSGYAMFFDALQYRFYCILMLLFVFIHILLDADFGPMRRAQQLRQVGDNGDREHVALTGRARCALVPLGGLLLFHFTALWCTGGGWARYRAGGSPASWIYWRETIAAVPSSSLVLLWSSTFGLVLALLAAACWGGKSREVILAAVRSGLRKGLVPAAILTLAWSIKGCCDMLETGTFLSSLLVGTLNPVYFPALVFLVACLTSFSTGTSYGTMAILIPTAIPVALGLDGGQYGLITVISLGAVLDGAIFGDHCSPISDTTILSSMSTGCDLMQHVRTQLPYGLLVAALALTCAYIPGARGLSSFVGLGLALVLMVLVLLTLRFFRQPVM
jgi:Na+/H+ antiporter NhaC